MYDSVSSHPRLIIYGIVFAAGAISWAWKTWKIRGYKNWPMTSGTVEHHFEVDEGMLGRTEMHHYVAYSYEVNGEYHSGNIETEDWDSFPIGTKIDVYFKQDDPTVSVGHQSAALLQER